MADTLESASRRFYEALNEMLAGDAGPVLDVWSHADDVTYMSPFGELLVGWEPIRASWEAQAAARLGGHVTAEGLRYVASTTLGVVLGFERGEVTVAGVPTPVDIRATSIYRLEEGRWSMIGHHTDPLG